MMDYKKAYYSLIERLKEAKEDDVLCDERYCCVIDELIQEPEECEDERMRDALIRAFKSLNTIKVWNGIELNNIITWLEKQGNKPKQTSIWKHWKDGIAGNGEGEPIYLVKNGNTYSLNSCLGCECDYIELSELDNLMLEKQGEQKPAWSVKDEAGLGDALWAIQQARTIAKDETDMGNLWYAEKWLNSLKERAIWKPSEEQIKAVRIARSFFVVNLGEHPETSGILIELEEQLKRLRYESNGTDA